MECQNCKTLEAVVDELTDEIARLRNRRRILFSTLRLLRQQVISQMEAEHAAEQVSIASADSDWGGRITAPVE